MIPIADSPRSRSFPYVNVAIIVINFIVFFYEVALSQTLVRPGVTDLDIFIFEWGNIPACTLDAVGVDASLTTTGELICGQQSNSIATIFSAMFMHGGWLHIIGNMLFLWIFGDNVEDAMGHILYGIFYLLAGAVATFSHIFVADWADRDLLVPAIGASGAVAGVMGAYIVLFPRATVAVILPLFFFIPFPVPAIILIGFWFIMQIFSGVASLGPEAVGAGGGVAYFAHIGGFVAGLLLVKIFAFRRPPPPSTPRPVRVRPRDFW